MLLCHIVFNCAIVLLFTIYISADLFSKQFQKYNNTFSSLTTSVLTTKSKDKVFENYTFLNKSIKYLLYLNIII